MKTRLLHGFILTDEIQRTLYNLWFFQKILVFCRPDEYEERVVRDIIKFDFEVLDKKQVPFRIQNEFLALAQKGRSFDDFIYSLQVA
ncbi:hypothetical protein [Alkaliphilus sp. B6464]|uniref:hypothetical protein n=1 Tax=Alkaliphilus sp. B6464 TaxID=2731219 RepID=UPI001BA549AB|nr:hypothetical protein [Alkaliphilus sp. B6464]QUH21861.1 hypothetical protein HYG84_18160 [Alkaliphilus sp. B6464]